MKINTIFNVMLRSAFLVALLGVSNPVIAFSGLKALSKKNFYRVDLCTQPCFSEITPGLYLSNARAAADRNILKHLNISHVLTVETRRLPKSTFADTNIHTLFIRAYDTPQTHLMPYFPIANSFIEEGLQKGNVLVHCHFGVSRSATLVIAYIMEKYKMSFEEAFIYVRHKRRFVHPNPGFVTQLRAYHRQNYEVKPARRWSPPRVNENVRKRKYKMVSLAAVAIGVIVPIVILVG